MERKQKSKTSFFKVMLNDFTRRLRLPPLFVQQYGEILPESIKLRTSSGETWNVELERVDKKTYCFSRGWNNFVVDAGLKIGEFVVFRFNFGESILDVSVYGYSCCERQISGRGSWVDASDSDEDVKLIKYSTHINNNFHGVKNKQSRAYVVGKEAGSDDDISEEEAARPQLKLCLREHHKSRVRVCKTFAVAAGLTSKKMVVLQFPPKRRRWPVKLIHHKDYSWFRLDIGKGWFEFRTKNGLVHGNSYLLEYIRDKNVIEVKLLDRAN